MKKKFISFGMLFALSAVGLLAACGGGGGGQSNPGSSSAQAKTYKVTVAEGTGYTVEGLEAEYPEGQRVTFTVTPTEEGTVVESVTVNGEAVAATSTGKYRFSMPAGDVTIVVKVVGVTGIELDTKDAKLLYVAGAAFDSKGVKVSAVFTGGEKKEVTTGVTFSTPDMTEAGKKTITVTYGGRSATYDIKVGTLEAVDVDIRQEGDKVLFSIEGDFAGFDTAAELTAAAKNAYMVDFQYNNNMGGPDWSRPYENTEIEFLANGDGKFRIDIDVTEFQGAGGTGIGYTLHFGLPQESGSDAGHASDVTLDKEKVQHDGKQLVVGARTYTISSNAGESPDDASKFWGHPGMIIVDTATPSADISSVGFRAEESKLVFFINGTFSNLESAQYLEDNLYVDLMQFGTWSMPCAAEDITLTTTEEIGHEGFGTWSVEFDITGKLDTNNDYFVHFDFSEGAKEKSSHGNLGWSNDVMTASTATDPTNGGVVNVFRKSDGESWMQGLLALSYLGGDYVISDSVTLDRDEDKVLFHVGGIYSGIVDNTNEDYYLDMMDFATNTDISVDGEGVSLTTLTIIPENEGASKGRWVLTLDVTNLLTEGSDYYCHFGPLPDGATYRTNLRAPADMQATSITTASAKYELFAASGYTESSETWKNGLAVLRYTPAN